jgi:hypothetical protein
LDCGCQFTRQYFTSVPTNAQSKRQLDNEVTRHTDLIKKYSTAAKRLWALEREVINEQGARYWARGRLESLEKKNGR